MLTNRIRRSISSVATLMIVSAILLVMIVFSALNYITEEKRATQQLYIAGKQIEERIPESLELHIWDMNDRVIEKTIVLEMANENVLGIIVNYKLHNYRKGKIKNEKGQIIDYLPQSENILKKSIFIFRKNIFRNEEIIASVEIYITDFILKLHMRNFIIKNLFQMLVLTVSIATLITAFFNVFIIRRIIRINYGIRDVSNGKYKIGLHDHGLDELSEIATNINTMSKMISERETDLIISNKHIESMKNYFSNIINSMPSMLISINEDGMVTQWNHAACLFTGIPATEAIGKYFWETTPVLEKYKDQYSEVLQHKKPLSFHRESFKKDGKNRYHNISFFPLFDNGTSEVAIRIDDITEIEQKDEQLRQSQKMETVGTLAGGLAHDFNNVLGGIIGTISVIDYKLISGIAITPSALKEYIETIKKSGKRAADMVQQLLTLSRKKEAAYVPVDLNRTIKHVVKICANTIDKSVAIAPYPADEDAMVNADPGQIEQVLLNLCVNANHAMTIMRKEGEKQGGVMSVSLRRIFADRHFIATHSDAKEETEYWLLSVQDTGIGMDSKTIAKIFDPFFTTKGYGKGTGLGLAMVYNIIQEHKGFVDVYSEAGKGSTFSLYIPAIKSSGKAAVDYVAEVKLKKGKGTILVVDDEAVMRDLAHEILEECGYEVLFAENGQEGVNIFKKENKRIDLVLLDMNMPIKSGKEAFIEMKNIDPKVRVLLASGFRHDERVDEIMNLGVSNFIQKPYTIENLSDAVANTIVC